MNFLSSLVSSPLSLLGVGGSTIGGGIASAVIGSKSFLGSAFRPFGATFPILGSIISSIGKYRSQKRDIENQSIFSNIQTQYATSNMNTRAGNMMTNSISSYGNALASANIAGGVMPNYFSAAWDRLSSGIDNFNEDMHALEFNATQRNATFSSLRMAARMSLYSSMIKSSFDAYDSYKETIIKGGVKGQSTELKGRK